MAKVDWDISGTGGQSVVLDTGSMRCQLAGKKLMLWNGNDAMENARVTAKIKFNSYSTSVYDVGGPVLRMNASGYDGYRDRIQSYNASTRRHRIERVVGGVATLLSYIDTDHPHDEFVNTRLSINGWEISIEEFVGGEWTLIGVIEDTDHTHASGYSGIHSDCYSTGYLVYFDDVVIAEET